MASNHSPFLDPITVVSFHTIDSKKPLGTEAVFLEAAGDDQSPPHWLICHDKLRLEQPSSAAASTLMLVIHFANRLHGCTPRSLIAPQFVAR